MLFLKSMFKIKIVYEYNYILFLWIFLNQVHILVTKEALENYFLRTEQEENEEKNRYFTIFILLLLII